MWKDLCIPFCQKFLFQFTPFLSERFTGIDFLKNMQSARHCNCLYSYTLPALFESACISSPVQAEMRPSCQFLLDIEGVDVVSCDLRIKTTDCHISKKGDKMVWKRHLMIWVTHLHLQIQYQSPFSGTYSQWHKYPEPLPTSGSQSDASRLLNHHRSKVSAV